MQVALYGAMEASQLGAALAAALPAPTATADHEDSEQMVRWAWCGWRVIRGLEGNQGFRGWLLCPVPLLTPLVTADQWGLLLFFYW